MALLTMFLRKQSLSTAATTLRQSDCFFDHLVSRLHSIHKTRCLVGRDLTTLEIKDAHNPYHLHKEHGESLVGIVGNLTNQPANKRNKHEHSLIDIVANPAEGEREQPISQASPTNLPLDSRKLKAMARVAAIGTDGQLPPNTLYLMEIGLNMDQIKEMARKCPTITCPGWERRLKPLIVFFLGLGVPRSDILNILYRAPQLCDLSLSKNIIPSMAYIETFGVDKSQWVKVIKRYPNLFTYSKQKVETVVDYMYELGLSSNKIGKCLTCFPNIIGCSIDDNLRPTAEYFRSMGVNLTSLFSNTPQVLCLSVECNLKPVTEFFLDKGFSIDEVGTMASRFGSIYCLSLTKNIIPKWNFFLTLDYPISELVKYPYYFGFSLEGRIKPRYSVAKECGVKLSLRQHLVPSDSEFEKFLNRSMKKVLDTQHGKYHSLTVTSDCYRK